MALHWYCRIIVLLCIFLVKVQTNLFPIEYCDSIWLHFDAELHVMLHFQGHSSHIALPLVSQMEICNSFVCKMSVNSFQKKKKSSKNDGHIHLYTNNRQMHLCAWTNHVNVDSESKIGQNLFKIYRIYRYRWRINIVEYALHCYWVGLWVVWTSFCLRMHTIQTDDSHHSIVSRSLSSSLYLIQLSLR